MVASAAAATSSALKWIIMGEGKMVSAVRWRRENKKERGDGQEQRGRRRQGDRSAMGDPIY